MARKIEDLAGYLPEQLLGKDQISYTPEELITEAIIAIALAKEGNRAPFDQFWDKLADNQELFIRYVENNLSLMALLKAEIEAGNFVVEEQGGQMKVVDLIHQRENQAFNPLSRLNVHKSSQIGGESKNDKGFPKHAEQVEIIHLAKDHLINLNNFKLMVKNFPNLKIISLEPRITALAVTPEMNALLRENGIKLEIKNNQSEKLAR